ncbi:hypothetical protein TUSST3_80480 [Streptomyces sp. TUS-ST3]|nr:hypothetical protein TUSST3_80480 [Streptomyces sp. TUS-ST3]
MDGVRAATAAPSRGCRRGGGRRRGDPRNCRTAEACSAFNYPAPCGQWGRRRFPNPPRTGRVGFAGTERVARGVVSGAGVSRVFLCGSVRRESEGLVMSRASICDQPLHS